MGEKVSRIDILSMFTDIANTEAISGLSQIVSTSAEIGNRIPLMQIKKEDVFLENTLASREADKNSKNEALANKHGKIVQAQSKFNIIVSNRVTSYIENKVSPIVKAKDENGDLKDMNKLYIALAYMKVYFKEQDKFAYFPLILKEITEKAHLFAVAKKTGSYNLNIMFDDKIFVNEDIIRYFYNLEYAENKQEHFEGLADTLDGFIPKDARENLESVVNYIYSFFKGKERSEFQLLYPDANAENSAVFMFFASQENYKNKREFNHIKLEDQPLMKAYLEYEQDENLAPSLGKELWYGSHTKNYPLGIGQATVLQRNACKDAIIPVVGAPGTGKSTLIMSLIANEITNRALSNIFNEKDYANLMLIVSTSNKAVDNITSALREEFPKGFCFIGGRATNVEQAAGEVANYSKWIESEPFNKDKMLWAEGEIRKILTVIKDRMKEYNSVHYRIQNTFAIHVSSYNILQAYVNRANEVGANSDEAPLKDMESLIKQISLLLKQEFDFEKIEIMLNNDLIQKMALIKAKLEKVGLISSIFGNKKEVLAELKEISFSNIRDFELGLELFTKIAELKNSYKEALKKQKIFNTGKVCEELLNEFQHAQGRFNDIINSKTAGEYHRISLYKLNYELYQMSLTYLEQKMLSEKENVLMALGYLSSKDSYKYLMEYGRDVKSQDSLLKYISLAYPVFSSTLASVSSIFPGIYPEKITPIRTLIADEAGMITSSDILPALRRSKRAVIIGDPKQLSPIVTIDDIFAEKLAEKYQGKLWDQYSPMNVSAFHRAAGTTTGGYIATGRGIVLDEHRRCAKEIAELFIKIAKYDGLKICSGENRSPAFNNVGQRLLFLDVKNSDSKSYKKINQDEIDLVDRLLTRLEVAGYDLKKDVGIITPYKEQEAALTQAFGNVLGHKPSFAKIGTVHKFQGVEFPVIIFSTVVSRKQDSLNFINTDPSLVNVAVSRAKESFMVVGDYSKLTSVKSGDNFVGMMASYIKQNGSYTKVGYSEKNIQEFVRDDAFEYIYTNEFNEQIFIDPMSIYNDFDGSELPPEVDGVLFFNEADENIEYDMFSWERFPLSSPF